MFASMDDTSSLREYINRLTYREIQIELKRLGLNAGGKSSVLRRRLSVALSKAVVAEVPASLVEGKKQKKSVTWADEHAEEELSSGCYYYGGGLESVKTVLNLDELYLEELECAYVEWLNSMSRRDLRLELKSLGLKSSGTLSVLRERLLTHLMSLKVDELNEMNEILKEEELREERAAELRWSGWRSLTGFLTCWTTKLWMSFGFGSESVGPSS